MLLLIVSFFNPYAGCAGFIATVIAISVSHFTGINKAAIQKGNYSYNALIIGIGMGTLFNFSFAFWILLFFIVIFSVILSVVLQNCLGKYGLPFLTIPFVLCFWLVMLVTPTFQAINFTYRNIYWMNDAYAIGSSYLVRLIMFFDSLEMPTLLSTFFKALSSLYFQNNVLAGIIIAVGVLIHSRIIFSLLILGFVTAFVFNNVVMAHPVGINYYLMGGNFILVSVAIGGFFIIPSIHSYLWAIVSVPLTFIVVMALGRLTGQWGLPVFSMPFCITVLCFLYFFSLKAQKGRVVLTPLQLYTPEKNLYSYLNNKERLQNINHIRFQLPIMGKWLVSQGYEGNITHKGDWSKALDFIIVDNELKTYKNYALNVDDFYCYNKPVLAPADGFVQQIEDYIDDNEIGKINQQKNWGNTIVIKHADGLYTKLSHLKKHSFKVKVGDYIKQGDIVGICGNSGRSPEPHLHFQVQTTPHIGSKTFAYPLAYYISEINGISTIKEFSVPKETENVSNVTTNETLKQAFEFLPGCNLTVSVIDSEENKWEVFTDAYNNSYLYCHTTKSFAYFKRNEVVFYFTSFEGDRNSLLYHFYVACYKIYLTTEPIIVATDIFPLQFGKIFFGKWLQDFFAPFYIFSRLHFESLNNVISSDFLNQSFEINTKQVLHFLSFQQLVNNSLVEIKDSRITSFTFIRNKKEIKAICTPKEY